MEVSISTIGRIHGSPVPVHARILAHEASVRMKKLRLIRRRHRHSSPTSHLPFSFHTKGTKLAYTSHVGSVGKGKAWQTWRT